MATTSIKIIEDICKSEGQINPDTLELVIILAVELAREGREGRKIGTIFVVGDTEHVFQHSRSLILDPLLGHPAENKRLVDPNVRETVKELAQLDGGFVVSDDGVVISAARYFDTVSQSLQIPLGLGSRHMAAASITKQTNAVAVVVSESSVVRLFSGGELMTEIIPEIWLMRHHGFIDAKDAQEQVEGDLTFVRRRRRKTGKNDEASPQ